MNELKKRILQLSYENKLSHIGSCITAVDIINEIYLKKKPNEKFVLSSGHAHIAHLVVMEKYGKPIKKIHDIHCNLEDGCDVATGSLGHGIGIATGMALADRNKKVFCLISDGECAEGSVWEALRIIKGLKLYNCRVHVNINGYSAYQEIDVEELVRRLSDYPCTLHFTYLHELTPVLREPQEAHYKILSKEEYESLIR